MTHADKGFCDASRVGDDGFDRCAGLLERTRVRAVEWSAQRDERANVETCDGSAERVPVYRGRRGSIPALEEPITSSLTFCMDACVRSRVDRFEKVLFSSK